MASPHLRKSRSFHSSPSFRNSKTKSFKFRVWRIFFFFLVIILTIFYVFRLKPILARKNFTSFSFFDSENKGKHGMDSSIEFSAQSLISEISPQLLKLFKSLSHPLDGELDRERLTSYYVSSLLQLKAQSMGTYYRGKEEEEEDHLQHGIDNSNESESESENEKEKEKNVHKRSKKVNDGENGKELFHHSCKSRNERIAHHRKSFPLPSPHFYALLHRYADFHKECVSKVRSWKNEITQNSNSTGCKYLYVMPPPTSGLGTKLVGLVSCIMYAILTNRVVVVPKQAYEHLLCQPFPRSSWFLPFSIPDFQIKDIVRMEDFLTNEAEFTYVKCRYGNLFNCKNSQKKLHAIPWLLMQSDAYFIPELYIIQPFKKLMDEIFPDRIVFTHLAQHFLLPLDDTWNSILHLKHAYMGHADRHVGMHIHSLTFDSRGRFSMDHKNRIPYIDQLVLECSSKISKVLPLPMNETSLRFRLNADKDADTDADISTVNGSKLISIFIASRFADSHSRYLKSVFLNGGLEEEAISVQYFTSIHEKKSYLKKLKSSFTHKLYRAVHHSLHSNFKKTSLKEKEEKEEGEKEEEVKEDERKAFSEIWMLSFMDDLFTSANSAFSFVAQGLGGHEPWVFNFGPQASKYSACFKRLSSEPCQLDVNFCPTFKYYRQYPQNISFLHSCVDKPHSFGLKRSLRS